MTAKKANRFSEFSIRLAFFPLFCPLLAFFPLFRFHVSNVNKNELRQYYICQTDNAILSICYIISKQSEYLTYFIIIFSMSTE